MPGGGAPVPQGCTSQTNSKPCMHACPWVQPCGRGSLKQDRVAGHGCRGVTCSPETSQGMPGVGIEQAQPLRPEKSLTASPMKAQ